MTSHSRGLEVAAGAEPNPPRLGGGGPLCDVIIPTRNRLQPLNRCLAGLRAQTMREFNVIVVDDASDPPIDPAVVAEGMGEVAVRVIRHRTPLGPAAARNTGVAASRAEFIAFIDDDIDPAPELLQRHLETVWSSPAGPRLTASFGPFNQPPDWRPNAWNLWEAHQAAYEVECLREGRYPASWRQFHTGNNLLSRELFLDAGGFNTELRRAEDDEFGLRLVRHGAVFVFQPDAVAWHYAERSLAAWLAIPAAYAHYDLFIDALHPAAGHAAAKQRELGRRNILLRLNRALFAGRRVRPVAVRATVGVARGLFQLRATALSMMALSAAYDLQYVGALHDELAGIRAGPPDLALPTGDRGSMRR